MPTVLPKILSSCLVYEEPDRTRTKARGYELRVFDLSTFPAEVAMQAHITTQSSILQVIKDG